MHWLQQAGLFQFINKQGFKWTSCFSLILLLPNIVSSEELFSYGTSISRSLASSWYLVSS